MRAADDLADSRHDKAQEAARLQSLEDQQQQETLGLNEARQRHAVCDKALSVFDTKWLDKRVRLGLGQVALDELPDWLVQKDKALEIAQALDQAGRPVQALQDEENDRRSRPHLSLADAAATPPHLSTK